MNLNRRQHLHMTLGSILGVTSTSFAKSDKDLIWRERTLLGMGTTLWLRAAHSNANLLEAALDASVLAIRHVEAQMSLFDNASALMQLNRDGLLNNADPHLIKVVRLAQHISKHSDGAFDVTIQPLWSVWSAAQKLGQLPTKSAVLEAKKNVGWRGLEIDLVRKSPRLLLANKGMSVSLNGIAQGYASDLVKSTLQKRGIQHALLDTGEWSQIGVSGSGKPWTLSIESTRTTLPTLVGDGRAIATSSDEHTSFSADHRYHHIFNPHTGYSPLQWSTVCVAAHSCALADGLTKVMFMADASQALQIAKAWDVDVLLVNKHGGWIASPKMPLMKS